MAPKRERSPPLPGDDRFGGDYSDERRTLLVRSDGARKCSERKWMNYNLPVPPSLLIRKVEEFDRLRWERERELVRRARLCNGGEGSSSAASSSSALPALPLPGEYDASRFESSIPPEDFVRDEDLEHTMAVVALQSVRGCGSSITPEDFVRDEDLEQTMAVVKLSSAQDAAMVVDLVSDED